MGNIKKIEEILKKKVSDFEISDFNEIGLNPELSKLLDYETCEKCAQDESIPEDIRHIFLSYIIVNKLTYAFETVSETIKKKEGKSNEELFDTLIDNFKNGDDDYIKVYSIYSALLLTSYNDEEHFNLKKYEKDVLEIVNSILDDLEFIGVGTFLVFAEKYFEMIYTISSAFKELYDVEILTDEIQNKLNPLVDDFKEHKEELNDALMNAIIKSGKVNDIIDDIGEEEFKKMMDKPIIDDIDIDVEEFEKAINQLNDFKDVLGEMEEKKENGVNND